jgi:hypothetical protein
LWILAPSCSARLLTGFGAKLDESGNWENGVYFLPEFFKTALVAINQLPVTEDTLWLRLLGRGATQQQAVNELAALPEGQPLRGNILELLANWRINVVKSENLSEEDRELLMNLSPAYQRWREETLQEGRQEERRQMVESILRVRFGELDEELSGAICASQQRFAIAPMLQLPPEELTRLLFNLSHEELLVWFGDVSWREDALHEGRREKVENFLKTRFGSLDEELSGAIAPMLQLPSEDLTHLLLTLSREELLKRFEG